MRDTDISLYFGLFTEIGIIAQLSRAVMEAEFEDGLLISHFTVLNHLVRVSDGQTPMQLARAFQIPKTSLTHTLMGLEQRGLIDMRSNPEDGRSKRVWLTPKGRAWRQEAIARVGSSFAFVAEAFPPEKVEPLMSQLTALRKLMDTARDT